METLLTHLSLTWAIFAGLMIVIEVLIPHFGCLFPGIAAAAALAVSFQYSLSVQLIVFTAALLMGVFLLRPYLLKKDRASEGVPARAHDLIGKYGVVTVASTPMEQGRVVVEGQDWAMRSEESFEVGAQVKVKTVDGIVLIVKK